MSIINWDILYINDPLRGRPLFNGQIYVGEPDLDPVPGPNHLFALMLMVTTLSRF